MSAGVLFCLNAAEVLSLSGHGLLIWGGAPRRDSGLGGASENNNRESVRAVRCGSDRTPMV
jgi:hypothetical protein